MRALFGRHAREFGRALAHGEWQRTAEGIVFPRQGALLAGEFAVAGHKATNLLTDFALGELRAALQPEGAVTHPTFATLYVCPWGSDFTPTSAITDLDLAVLAGEYGDGPEGYTEAARPEWLGADRGHGLMDNVGSPAIMTVATASALPIFGFALVKDGTGKRSGRDALAPFDPSVVTTSTLDVDEATPYGWHRSALGFEWYDPDNDDFFDGSEWADPSLDDFAGPIPVSQNVFAIARLAGAPYLASDTEPLAVTYSLTLR